MFGVTLSKGVLSFNKSHLSTTDRTFPHEDPDWLPASLFDNTFGEQNHVKDFLEVPEVNAIINIRARAMASWRLQVVSKVTELPVSPTDPLAQLINTPNWFQGQSEFWRQSSIFRDLWGNEYLFSLTPVGLPNSVKAMFTIDPALIKIKYDEKGPFFLDPTGEKIRYIYDDRMGRPIPLESSDIIHLNDNRVISKTAITTDDAKFLKGTSKLTPLKPAIQNIRAAYEKRHIILRMPIGVMSNGVRDAIGQAVPLDPDEKTKLKRKIMTRGAHPILTSLALGYDSFNIDSRKMGLFEETREDTLKICDAYGVPYALLANAQKGGLANSGFELKEAKKQFYEEAIIPDAKEKTDALNLKAGTATGPSEIIGAFKHLPIFAEDVKSRASSLSILITALSKALSDEVITVEQYQAELKKFGI